MLPNLFAQERWQGQLWVGCQHDRKTPAATTRSWCGISATTFGSGPFFRLRRDAIPPSALRASLDVWRNCLQQGAVFFCPPLRGCFCFFLQPKDIFFSNHGICHPRRMVVKKGPDCDHRADHHAAEAQGQAENEAERPPVGRAARVNPFSLLGSEG